MATFPQASASVKYHNGSYCSNKPHPLKRGSFTIYSPHLTQINNVSPVPVTNKHADPFTQTHQLELMITAKLSI